MTELNVTVCEAGPGRFLFAIYEGSKIAYSFYCTAAGLASIHALTTSETVQLLFSRV